MLKKSWNKSDKVENRANNSLLGDVFAAIATVLLLKLPKSTDTKDYHFEGESMGSV